MAVKPAVGDVVSTVTTAVGEATDAYDALVNELAKGQPTADDVLAHSAKFWTSSLKVWANVVLAPAAIVSAIAEDGKPGAGG